MAKRWDGLTTATAIALVLSALLACKKKQQEETPVASVSAAPEPPPPPPPEPKAPEARRYDKETADTGTVRVSFANVKVYLEASDHGPEAAVLAKGTLVNRKARFEKFVLIEYPTTPGQTSLGWVESRFLATQVDKTAKPTDVAKQADAGTTVATSPTGTATAAPTGTATAAPTGTGTATAAATGTTTAAPTNTATATADAGPQRPQRIPIKRP